MTTYRITFELKSSILTPFQSDIIWGHLVWAYRYLFGVEKLEQFLDSYQEKPTLVSNAFPKGMFPKPILKPLTLDSSLALAGQELNKKGKVAHLDKLKYLKKQQLLPIDIIEQTKDNLSYYSIYEKVFLDFEKFQDKMNAPVLQRAEEIVSHNTINRITDTVTKTGPGFFQKDELFYNKVEDKYLQFWFLLQSDFWDKSDLIKMMEFIEHDGFGADKTTGKGAIRNTQIESNYNLSHASNANAFVCLSNFVATENLGSKGYYDIFCKFGKLGAEFARVKNPFKRPILFMKAGSTFFVNQSNNNYYGCLLEKINYEKELEKLNIKHYAFAFPFYVFVSE